MPVAPNKTTVFAAPPSVKVGQASACLFLNYDVRPEIKIRDQKKIG
jgi:hypothetical protein